MGSKSYDVIGEIIILNDRVSRKEALELLEKNRNAKTVLYKARLHSGRYRTRGLKFLAGKRKKTTLYRESGCLFRVNVEKCYFSPRLGNERLRIAKLVKPDENVLVMFSGVAPYPIVIAKNSGAKEITGVELNPAAHRFAMENIELNRVQDKVRVYCGDVRKVVPEIGRRLKKKFDRIVMPLPGTAEKFLDIALRYLKKNGWVHFYAFEHENNIPHKITEKIKKYCDFRNLSITMAGNYSPGKYRVCADFQVNGATKAQKKKKI